VTGGRSSQLRIVWESLLGAQIVVHGPIESSKNDVACAGDVLVM